MESNWVHSTLRPPVGLLCLPYVIMMMEKVVEWWLAGETEILGRKPAPVPLCPPQTPHAARTWTCAAAVGNQWLTAWAMAWPDWITYWWDSLVGMTSVDLDWFTSLIAVQNAYFTQIWISTLFICQYQFIRVLRMEFYELNVVKGWLSTYEGK
jgi:hypothetical protein